jgi:hypothetical protein
VVNYEARVAAFYGYVSGIEGVNIEDVTTNEPKVENVTNCPVAPLPEYSSFYLPSKDELNKMYVNLHLESKGAFSGVQYWSSTEAGGTGGVYQDFSDGTQADNFGNSTEWNVRPARHFEMNTSDGEYDIGDEMPSGGHIFEKVDLGDGDYKYYESAPADIDPQVWCNILTVSYNQAGIGYGLANSQGIIAKVGHTTSAAKDCLDYEL